MKIRLLSILSCKHKRLPDSKSYGVSAAPHHTVFKAVKPLCDSESEQPLSGSLLLPSY
ncbi:hypothetical protein NEICINOT_04697 [Neisseria cinerea ATCC 14685]|uniref:Uncharacterized protein n=1 Tax=Neisseria cinerea ATCC 14685 TaxID=546262 RepID=D0W4U9_NEICI|nr:hypothetical protein NEICINOT_04697 [Neisseria cinerea ATCC 14685]